MIILLIFGLTASFADDFQTLLSRNKMQFCAPRGLKEVAPVNNRQMNYEKAYRHKKKKLEVRYAVRPFDKLLAEYKRSKKDSTFFMYDPNTFYKTSFTSTLLNIAEGRDYGYTIFDSLELKINYNADWGAMTTVEADKNFGMGYKYCRVIYIFKKDVGEAYYFFLANEKETFSAVKENAMRALTFKK